MQAQRRTFLKAAAGGATGLALFRARHAFAAWPKTGTLEINPTISNLLVVACKDQGMVKSTPPAMAFTEQNGVVDSARVAANLDAMAMRLANAGTADEAWKAIFRSSKPWASTLVAIKINVTEVKNMPRLAVVEKLCRVVAGLGVPAANIIVYDGGPKEFASATSNYAPFFSATDKSKIPGVVSNINEALGGTTDAPLPDGTSAKCTGDIATGKVDILINIAINKGHIYYGKASMCMKNHYGTFAPDHDSNYLFTINKSDALVGGTPPRQQLCIVDSLFAMKTYNSSPDTMPYYLVMGTFAPAVDYLTIKKVREEVLKYSHDSTIVDSYLPTFGYAAKDAQWVLVPPGGATSDAGAGGSGGSGDASAVSGTGGNKTDGAVPGTGGAGGGKAGGSSGSGGVGKGGASGQATATGGGPGAGGVVGSGGTAVNATGGAQGSGGVSAASSSGSGGIRGTGGAGAGGVATGGAQSGGSGSKASDASSGCGCRVGSTGRGLGGLGVTAAIGAVIVDQLRKLAFRQERSMEQASAPEPEDRNPGG
jgi:hypothetical protein